jgi:hypothetical protein
LLFFFFIFSSFDSQKQEKEDEETAFSTDSHLINESLPGNIGSSVFLVFSLADPELVESPADRQNRAADPSGVLSLDGQIGNDLDLTKILYISI